MRGRVTCLEQEKAAWEDRCASLAQALGTQEREVLRLSAALDREAELKLAALSIVEALEAAALGQTCNIAPVREEQQQQPPGRVSAQCRDGGTAASVASAASGPGGAGEAASNAATKQSGSVAGAKLALCRVVSLAQTAAAATAALTAHEKAGVAAGALAIDVLDPLVLGGLFDIIVPRSTATEAVAPRAGLSGLGIDKEIPCFVWVDRRMSVLHWRVLDSSGLLFPHPRCLWSDGPDPDRCVYPKFSYLGRRRVLSSLSSCPMGLIHPYAFLFC
jgi:hypothetical protein